MNMTTTQLDMFDNQKYMTSKSKAQQSKMEMFESELANV